MRPCGVRAGVHFRCSLQKRANRSSSERTENARHFARLSGPVLTQVEPARLISRGYESSCTPRRAAARRRCPTIASDIAVAFLGSDQRVYRRVAHVARGQQARSLIDSCLPKVQSACDTLVHRIRTPTFTACLPRCNLQKQQPLRDRGHFLIEARASTESTKYFVRAGMSGLPRSN